MKKIDNLLYILNDNNLFTIKININRNYVIKFLNEISLFYLDDYLVIDEKYMKSLNLPISLRYAGYFNLKQNKSFSFGKKTRNYIMPKCILFDILLDLYSNNCSINNEILNNFYYNLKFSGKELSKLEKSFYNGLPEFLTLNIVDIHSLDILNDSVSYLTDVIKNDNIELKDLHYIKNICEQASRNNDAIKSLGIKIETNQSKTYKK